MGLLYEILSKKPIHGTKFFVEIKKVLISVLVDSSFRNF